MFPDKYQKVIEIMTKYCDGYDEETGGHNYRLYHQLRVAETGYRICQSEEVKEANEKIVVIGGLFHDIGRIAILKENNTKTLKYEQLELDKQKGHEEASKIVLTELLAEELSLPEIEEVCLAIHKPEDHFDRTSENKILFDADFLDELGALNLFRMFTYSGITKRSLKDTLYYWFDTDRDLKLAKTDKCFTNFAKSEAKRRIDLQDQITKELKNGGFKPGPN